MVKYKKSKGEIIFEICNTIFMVLLVIVTLYPVYYVLIASVSDPMKILEGNGLLLYPKDFSLENLEIKINEELYDFFIQDHILNREFQSSTNTQLIGEFLKKI